MSINTLHIQATYDELDGFVLANGFLGQGQAAAVHVDRGDGVIDIFTYRRDYDGKTRVKKAEVRFPEDCGCP